MHNGRVGLITGVSNPTQEQNIDDSISVLRWIQRMQHFGLKEDFGMFSQNPPVTCFVIRIRK